MAETTPNSSSWSQAAGSSRDKVHERHPSQLSSEDILKQLREDRLWLLRQIDEGRWPEWRLDLAALERELGLLLDQASERWGVG